MHGGERHGVLWCTPGWNPPVIQVVHKNVNKQVHVAAACLPTTNARLESKYIYDLIIINSPIDMHIWFIHSILSVLWDELIEGILERMRRNNLLVDLELHDVSLLKPTSVTLIVRGTNFPVYCNPPWIQALR